MLVKAARLVTGWLPYPAEFLSSQCHLSVKVVIVCDYSFASLHRGVALVVSDFSIAALSSFLFIVRRIQFAPIIKCTGNLVRNFTALCSQSAFWDSLFSVHFWWRRRVSNPRPPDFQSPSSRIKLYLVLTFALQLLPLGVYFPFEVEIHSSKP